MRLVCANEDWLGKYQDLCSQRDLPFKPWPSRLALLAAYGNELVAGVMVYDSAGPFLHFQHLVTNPKAPIKLRWAAVDLMASEILTLCRHMNKLPMVLVSHKGIAKILKRHGLQDSLATNFSCHYSQLEKHDYEVPQAVPFEPPTQPACRRPHSAAPRAVHHRDEEDNPPLHPPEHRGGVPG